MTCRVSKIENVSYSPETHRGSKHWICPRPTTRRIKHPIGKLKIRNLRTQLSNPVRSNKPKVKTHFRRSIHNRSNDKRQKKNILAPKCRIMQISDRIFKKNLISELKSSTLFGLFDQKCWTLTLGGHHPQVKWRNITLKKKMAEIKTGPGPVTHAKCIVRS